MPSHRLFSCVVGRTANTAQEQLVAEGNQTAGLQNVCWLLACLPRCHAAETFSCLPRALKLLRPD